MRYHENSRLKQLDRRRWTARRAGRVGQLSRQEDPRDRISGGIHFIPRHGSITSEGLARRFVLLGASKCMRLSCDHVVPHRETTEVTSSHVRIHLTKWRHCRRSSGAFRGVLVVDHQIIESLR